MCFSHSFISCVHFGTRLFLVSFFSLLFSPFNAVIFILNEKRGLWFDAKIGACECVWLLRLFEIAIVLFSPNSIKNSESFGTSISCKRSSGIIRFASIYGNATIHIFHRGKTVFEVNFYFKCSTKPMQRKQRSEHIYKHTNISIWRYIFIWNTNTYTLSYDFMLNKIIWINACCWVLAYWNLWYICEFLWYSNMLQCVVSFWIFLCVRFFIPSTILLLLFSSSLHCYSIILILFAAQKFCSVFHFSPSFHNSFALIFYKLILFRNALLCICCWTHLGDWSALLKLWWKRNKALNQTHLPKKEQCDSISFSVCYEIENYNSWSRANSTINYNLVENAIEINIIWLINCLLIWFLKFAKTERQQQNEWLNIFIIFSSSINHSFAFVPTKWCVCFH